MLSSAEKIKAIKAIKTKGFYIFRSVLKKNEINEYSKILLQQKSYGQASFYKKKIIDKFTKQIFNLQSKNKAFLKLIDNKLMNKINSHFLNDKNYKSIDKKYPNYTLSQFVARSSGKKPCVIHMDDKCPSTSDQVNYLQWAVPLTNTNSKNGCTTILRNSHKLGIQPIKGNLKNFQDVILNKGDIAVWDGRIWHGAKPNKTMNDRWIIIITFTRWFFKPHYDIARSFPKKFYKYLNINLKIILGFASISKSNEKMGLVQRGDLKSANNFINNRKF